MSNAKDLKIKIKDFFDIDSESVSYEEICAAEKRTALLIDEYGWDVVRQAFLHYVQTECETSEDVARAAFHYEELGWNKKPVPDPYEFLGYLYYKAGFRKASHEAAHALDDLCITILPASGYPEANIYYHPYYAAETDPKMIAAVERWRQRKADDSTRDNTDDSIDMPGGPRMAQEPVYPSDKDHQ